MAPLVTDESEIAQSASSGSHELRRGVLKTLPLMLGVIPFGIAYGVLAVQTGLTIFETMLMSLIVFAGGSQFLAVGMIASGVDGFTVVISTLLMNLRHLMMGLSISPYLAETTPKWQRALAFGMTDESYLVTITHYREQGVIAGSPHFMLGSSLVIYVAWALSSLAGAVSGNAISDPMRWGLDFMMPVTFLTMLLPQVKSLRLAAVSLISATVATASYVLIPGKWYIIVAVVTATAAGVVLEVLSEKRIAQ